MGEKVEVDTEKETEPLRRQQQGQFLSCTCFAGSAFFCRVKKFFFSKLEDQF